MLLEEKCLVSIGLQCESDYSKSARVCVRDVVAFVDNETLVMAIAGHGFFLSSPLGITSVHRLHGFTPLGTNSRTS